MQETLVRLAAGVSRCADETAAATAELQSIADTAAEKRCVRYSSSYKKRGEGMGGVMAVFLHTRLAFPPRDSPIGLPRLRCEACWRRDWRP